MAILMQKTPSAPGPLTVRREPLTRPDRARWLIYGPSGVGKTTFGSEFHSKDGESLSIYAAPPGNHAAVRDRAHLAPATLDEFRQVVAGADVAGFDAVVVDDLQSVIEWLIRGAEVKFGKDFDDLSYGRGFGWVRLELFSMLDALARRAKHVVVVSKEKNVMKLEKDGPVLVGTLPSMPPNIWEPLSGDFDFVGYAKPGLPKPGGRHDSELTFYGGPKTLAKSRHPIQWPAPLPLDGRAVYDAFYNAPFVGRQPKQETK